MATAYKVLGQVAPSATTATTLYTVPASTQSLISSLVICNRGAASSTFRVAIRPAGATLEAKHYLFYDAVLDANNAAFFTLGITLATTDVVTVYAGTADFSFSVYGSEIT